MAAVFVNKMKKQKSIGVELIINLPLRVLKFPAFQYFYRLRNIKYHILKSKTKSGILARNVQGSRMQLHLDDEGISADLALDGIREPMSTKTVKEEVKQGYTVVEIGANIGYYALMESRLVGSKGRIYAIEPSPGNFRNLKKNIELNGYKNIESFELGIGDKKGTAKIFISPHSNLSSLVVQKNKKVIDTVDIKISTLDEFLKGKKSPDFIRMDVEGYEYNIIRGMKNILRSKKPMKIFIELHPHIMGRGKTEYVLKTLEANGFEIKKMFRCFTMPEMKVKSRKDFDYSSMKIESVMKDHSIISGSKGAFEIFFERK